MTKKGAIRVVLFVLCVGGLFGFSIWLIQLPQEVVVGVIIISFPIASALISLNKRLASKEGAAFLERTERQLETAEERQGSFMERAERRLDASRVGMADQSPDEEVEADQR